MKKTLRRTFHSIFFQFFLVAAVLWAYHCICPHWEKALNPKISPFFGVPSMDFSTWIIFPLIAFGVYLLVFRTELQAKHQIPLPILLVLMMALKVAIDISVALINGGLPALSPDILQYYADVPYFESIGDIFRNYVQKAPKLTVHSGTHPPGGTLFMWLVAHLFVYDKLTVSFLIILFAPLSLIPMYLLAEQVYGRRSNMKLATIAKISKEIEFREGKEYYPRISYRSLSEEVKKLKSMGFHGTQIDFDFVPSDSDCRKIRTEFSSGGIEIAALSGYNWSDRNLAEPDEQKRKKNINFLKSRIEIAKKIGTNIVVTWGGFKESKENIV